MDKRLRNRWVKWLRSGEYVQGNSFLRQDEAFCCLGVLVDIEYDGYWVDEIDSPNSFDEGSFRMGSGKACMGPFDGRGMPSRNFLKKVGLSQDEAEMLANFNDEGWSFKRIARWIERNIK